MNQKFTETELREAVAKSYSVRNTLITLGLNPNGGGGYRTIYKFIKEWNIDISHFTGMGWNAGKTHSPKRPIEDYLTNKQTITSHHFRLRLIKEGIFAHQCSECKLTEWNSKPIPIELEHINGNHFDNTLSNLRLLCPNCHAQTETYRGKNRGAYFAYAKPKPLTPKVTSLLKGKKIRITLTKRPLTSCQTCDQVINVGSSHCISCAHKKQERINWPEKEQLEKMIWETSRLQLAKQLGVSDKAISKRCKSLEIAQPPRGYWSKQKK